MEVENSKPLLTKRGDPVLAEAKRLYKLGFAIHWLMPKSKRPVESGWTTGPRKPWVYLASSYTLGYNVGVRLGEPSKLGEGYLAVIDVDVKSKLKHHRQEAIDAAKALTAGLTLPVVSSGRGNGSMHVYCLTAEPFKTFNPAQSKEMVKVHMPSKKASKKELEQLSKDEIENGIRLSHAWEVSLYSNGRQVVLPPSIHPDTGRAYEWQHPLGSVTDLSVVSFAGASADRDDVDSGDDDDFLGGQGQGSDRAAIKASERSEDVSPLDFTVEVVDLGWLPISDKTREGIINGTGVSDRSGFLLPAATALHSAGLTQNEVLSVLSDPNTFLGACAYDHAKTRNRQRAVEWLYKYTVRKVFAERSAVGLFGPISEMPEEKKLTGDELEAQEKFFRESRSWRQDIQRSGPKGDGPPKSNIQNVTLILKHSVCTEIFKRNVFAFRDAYGCDTPWGGKIGHAIEDDDVALIKLWLGKNWNFEPGKDVIYDAITNLACENAYDPIKEMLETLPPWDKKPRLDHWLKKHFGAEGDDEYLAQVFRKWIVAMIMRVYEPGAKFDWMPIFEGLQGVGKSSFGRLLCGDRYFLDWLPNLADKDAALALQGMWVVEMGELSQFRKNEMEVIKGFITRTVDKVRPPFGRKMIESARRCVFFGTTNRDKYLQDDTGNRRLKPVKVGALNFKALERDRAQLFAEAKYLYDEKIETGATLNLTGEAKVFEAATHKHKMIEDDSHVMYDQITAYLEKVKKSPELYTDFDPRKIKINDLFQGGGTSLVRPLHFWPLNQKNRMLAAKALKMMGATKHEMNYGNVWELAEVETFSKVATHQDFF